MIVEIYSDVACPWCYVGKKRFEQALAAFPGRNEVEVVFRPFQLDPSLSTDPAQAVPARQHYQRRFGPRFLEMESRMTEVAAAEGIDYRGGEGLVTSTFPAHRLLWLASQEYGPAVQSAVKEALFRAYFTDGRNISDTEALTEIAGKAGMDASRVRSFLASEEGTGEVREQIRAAQEMGIQGVPMFIFEGQWGVSGAQEIPVFLRILEQISERTGSTVPAEDAPACADDTCAI